MPDTCGHERSLLWEPSPTTWPPRLGSDSERGSTDASALAQEGQHRAVATVAGTFAVDGLDGPLNAWLHRVTGLGDRVALRWVSGASACSSFATSYTITVRHLSQMNAPCSSETASLLQLTPVFFWFGVFRHRDPCSH